MPPEQAVALVIRGTDWSETSRIVTLFTREFGKLRALAKGGRRLKSNFDCAFDLLTVCRVVFLRKSTGGLDLLTEARMEERFPALRQDLTALHTGYYFAELLDAGTQDYDPHPVLFDQAVAGLRCLGGSTSARDLATTFELVWLRELGYSPRLDVCVTCGREAVPGGSPQVIVSPSAGGLLCPSCGPSAPDRRRLTAESLATLRAWIAALETGAAPNLTPWGGNDAPTDGGLPSPAGTAAARPVAMPFAANGEIRQYLGQTVSFVLGRRPRMLTYIDGR